MYILYVRICMFCVDIQDYAAIKFKFMTKMLMPVKCEQCRGEWNQNHHL